jgi:hypothetical protein
MRNWAMSAVVVTATLSSALPTHAQTGAIADNKIAAPVPQLTDVEFARLQDRLMGSWLLNAEKSTYFSPEKQSSFPYGFIYERAANRSVTYVGADGPSVQYYDGKVYPTAVAGETVTRTPLDEFTVDNVVSQHGKPSFHNTQFLSADGKVMVSISRRPNPQSGEIPVSFRVFDKVPDGTRLWPESPKN